MTLRDFRDILNTVGVSVYHGNGSKEKNKFISWFETARNYEFADGIRSAIKYKAAVVYFTKTEYDEEIVDKIENLFDENEIAYSSAEIEYISEVKVWAYSWEVEFIWHLVRREL